MTTLVQPLVAALSWNPQIKGGLIIFGSILILCGSVYLLLGTNTGARVGFLLAAAGLMGWMVIMGAVWTAYGIGLTGRLPAWKVQTVVRGDASRATQTVLRGFPNEWRAIELDDPESAEAQAAADHALAPPPDTGERGVFTSSSDYAPVAAYAKGGEDYFFTLRHRPHYFLTQVRAVRRAPAAPGEAPASEPDPNAPVVSVLMVRDLGSLRQPPAVVLVSSTVLFVLLVWVLHVRDKEIARRAEEPADA